MLADEPTGNLDTDSAARVMSLLLSLTRAAGKTLVMATHDRDSLPLADRVGRIEDGNLSVAAGTFRWQATGARNGHADREAAS